MTYRLIAAFGHTQVLLIRVFIYHVSQSGAKIRIIESAIFKFQFETGVNTQV